jgi:hypothetical protein
MRESKALPSPPPTQPPHPPSPRLPPADATKRKGDFNRRTSSGNWIEDRVTWKEEMAYKKAMGFL